MKELDKTKKYDLSKLTDGQLSEMLCWLQMNDDESWKHQTFKEFKEDNHLYCLYYRNDKKDWYFEKSRVNLTCATELFEDEKSKTNKDMSKEEAIKQINEHIDKCIQTIRNSNSKSKNMTEEEKELWLFVYKEYVSYNYINPKQKADQAVKDFRAALKM